MLQTNIDADGITKITLPRLQKFPPVVKGLLFSTGGNGNPEKLDIQVLYRLRAAVTLVYAPGPVPGNMPLCQKVDVEPVAGLEY